MNHITYKLLFLGYSSMSKTPQNYIIFNNLGIIRLLQLSDIKKKATDNQ